MRSAVIAALLSVAFAESDLERRDAAEDFDQAADALISSYVGTERLASMTEALGSAASEASITEDIDSAIFSALKESELPSWFENNVPTEFQEEISALETAIDNLRPVATVVEVTTTDDGGSTVTTSVSTTMIPPQMVTSTITTETTDDQGNPSTATITTTATVTPTGSSEDDTEETTSEDLACMPTAMAHAAAGVAAIVGAVMAM